MSSCFESSRANSLLFLEGLFSVVSYWLQQRCVVVSWSGHYFKNNSSIDHLKFISGRRVERTVSYWFWTIYQLKFTFNISAHCLKTFETWSFQLMVVQPTLASKLRVQANDSLQYDVLDIMARYYTRVNDDDNLSCCSRLCRPHTAYFKSKLYAINSSCLRPFIKQPEDTTSRCHPWVTLVSYRPLAILLSGECVVNQPLNISTLIIQYICHLQAAAKPAIVPRFVSW